jgi:hypothetical protein
MFHLVMENRMENYEMRMKFFEVFGEWREKKGNVKLCCGVEWYLERIQDNVLQEMANYAVEKSRKNHF